MKIAITGATGFVGRAVLKRAAAGFGVRALTRKPQAPKPGMKWVRGDLADRGALAELVSGADTVLHIAGVVNTPDPMGFHLGNVEGTQALIEATRASGSARLVFVSSLAAREPDLSAYGRSKRNAEDAVRASGLDWTIVRPPAIYGPRDREILELFRLARRGIVPMPPPGRASLIHVDDLARLLLVLTLGGPAVSAQMFEPDDGHADGWSHRELGNAIGAALGRRVIVPHVPRSVLMWAASLDGLLRGGGAKLTRDRVGYMSHPNWVSDADCKVPEALWTPSIETRQGLADTAAWYREAGWL